MVAYKVVMKEASHDLIRKLLQKSSEPGNKSYSSHQLVGGWVATQQVGMKGRPSQKDIICILEV